MHERKVAPPRRQEFPVVFSFVFGVLFARRHVCTMFKRGFFWELFNPSGLHDRHGLYRACTTITP